MSILKISVLALTLLLTFSSNSQAQSSNQYNNPDAFLPFEFTYFKEPLPAPPVKWYDERGNLITIGQYHGKVVLLNVWATWCAPCVHEMPSLDKLQKRYKDAGLEVVAVASQQTVTDVRRFFLKKRIRNLDIYVDPTQSVGKGYKLRTMPTTYLIGRKGEVVALLDGAEDWFSKEAQKAIEDELRFGMIATPPSNDPDSAVHY